MRMRFLVAIVLVASVGAGCSRIGGGTTSGGATIAASAPAPSASQSVASASASTALAEYVDAAALAKLSEKDRAEATSAQFYALQFGRPGAPRTWQGDTGASGKIAVGPYVRVNNLDCREFSHVVTLSGQSYTKQGTACREQDGSWTVTAI